MLDKKEIMEFITENDVKFIRLAFCDIFGNLKNISIMPSVLEKAFDSGISFDASSIMGFGCLLYTSIRHIKIIMLCMFFIII